MIQRMLTSLRMTGSSIAAPSAAAWVTDFLKAAAFARGSSERDPDDLRLAFSVLTTRWHRLGRRLTARDVAAFHGAFGGQRLRRLARLRSPTLSRDALLDGAERLLGPGFADAYGDPARTGWGIVFLDPAERAAYVPESRLSHAALGELAPPRSAPEQQRWHTYPAVPVASARAALDALAEVERWPEFGSELGRFTPLRSGGLPGQTFEIEVVASPLLRAPVYTRGYVTATRVLRGRAELDAYPAQLAHEAPDLAPLPDGATVAGVVELVTHAGHFIGRGISRLVVFEHEGGAFVRDVGSWDPMPPHLALAYGVAGRRAQAAFWGDEHEAKSMLRQLARRL
jgi:hypothetical protein